MIPDAYDRAARIIAATGQNPEGMEIALEVERLRFAFRIYEREGVAGTVLPFNAVHAARESM
jgi:hypothetical protein